MKIQTDRKLDFDDISLISRQISTIESRNNIKINIKFCNNFYKIPIIASPMRDVCDGNIAREMEKIGGFGIIHRFLSIEDQIKESLKVKNPICAVGINNDLERYSELYKIGVRTFCIDVANSSSINVKNKIKEYLECFSDTNFIVGNVLSKEGIEFYNDIKEVKAYRVGVAGGSGCTTKNSTGMYHPYASLLNECYNITDKKIILDGGIKEPQDFCKSIALGADFVMLGRIIAATKESPAELTKDGKLYHGSASFENQKYYKNTPKYIEGRSIIIPFKNESLEQVINTFQEGLISSMSYANAKTIEDYRNNVEIIRIR